MDINYWKRAFLTDIRFKIQMDNVHLNFETNFINILSTLYTQASK